MTVKILGSEDRALLERVEPGVLDGSVDPSWAAEFVTDDRHHLAVAVDAGTVVGIASALHYVHPDKAPELWVNEVGVAPNYRGRGIAKRLLDALFDHGASLGCAKAWVLTEQQNEAGHRLYSSAGGRRDDGPVMYTFSLLGREGPDGVQG